MKTKLLSLTLLLISLASSAQTDDADKAAVRKVVEAETRAYLDANAALMLAQWSDKPYVERQHASLIPMLKVPFLKGPTLKPMVGSYMKTIKPSTHTRRQSDYEAHVSGDMAWITYTQRCLDYHHIWWVRPFVLRLTFDVPNWLSDSTIPVHFVDFSS